MTNMSYCRFQNTRGDLRDCEQTLMEMIDCQHMSEEARKEDRLEAASDLSKEEAQAALHLLDIARELNELHEDSTLMADLRKAAGKEGA